MSVKAYEANYNTALTFLKYNQKDAAIETLKRALSQVPDDEKNENNAVYLSILSVLSFLLVEKSEVGNSDQYVEQGLAVKKDHADLLFVKSLILLDQKRYDEVLEVLITYLLTLGEADSMKYDYRYTHDQALKEVFDTLIPTAYRYAFQYDKISNITERLCKASDNESLKKARDIMVEIDKSRNHQQN
jgi:tetratricopeptide (TPR) repeat protein